MENDEADSPKAHRRLLTEVSSGTDSDDTSSDVDSVCEVEEAHQTPSSPVHLLPVEILREIFVQSKGQPTYFRGTRPWSRWPRYISSLPFNVSQVCAHWREIALDTAILWNHLWTIDLGKTEEESRGYTKFLKEILSRTRAPLHLHIIADRGSARHPVFDLLISLSMRWETIVLEFHTSIIVPLFSCVKGRVASLRSITLTGLNPDKYIDAGAVDMFEEAPCLQEVMLYETVSVNFLCPLCQVIRLDAKNHHPQQCYSFTDFSSSLTSLTVNQLTTVMPQGSIDGTYTLANLTELHIRLPMGDEYLDHLGSLVLPSLRTLYLRHALEPVVMPHVATMIAHSDQLQNLYIRSLADAQSNSPEDLMMILCTHPLLVNLYVPMPHPDVLHRLALTEGNVIVPLLQVCTFNSITDLSDQQVINLRRLIASRCELGENHGGPVQRILGFHLTFDGDVSESIHNCVKWRQILLFDRNYHREEETKEVHDLGYILRQYILDAKMMRGYSNRSLIPRIRSTIDTLLAMDVGFGVLDASRISETLKYFAIFVQIDLMITEPGQTEDPLYQATKVAYSVLRKWRLLMEERLPEFRCPMIKSQSPINAPHLLYLCDSSPLRESMDADSIIVDGISEYDLPTESVHPWVEI